ncbi:MAG: uridine kinase [Acidobacteriota bacterium]
MTDLETAVDHILNARRSIPTERSMLVAISGIDGCGKGYVTARIIGALEARGVRAAAINIDGWLNLPNKRFDPSNPAEHFYSHAIRFDAMFAELILPLRDQRSVRIVADYAEETATEYRPHTYEFEDIEVIALEGIYLLKRAFSTYYDLSIWIECSFDTALERAIARSQEGLPPEDTIRAYRTIYFPAQELHFQRDNPKTTATLLVNNDPRLGPVSWDQ